MATSFTPNKAWYPYFSRVWKNHADYQDYVRKFYVRWIPRAKKEMHLNHGWTVLLDGAEEGGKYADWLLVSRTWESMKTSRGGKKQ